MAYPATDAQKAAFMSSHDMTTRVTVLRGSMSLGDIPVASANVFATYGTRGGRDAALVVDRSVIEAGLLDPMSDIVVIRTGIRNSIEVPIFTGRVDTQNDLDDGTVQVPLLSTAAELIRAEFEQPWAVQTPLFSVAEITEIIQSVNSSWGVETSRATTRPIPANLVFEYDPGQALDQIAQGSSLIWQPNRVGGFEVYDNPYAIGPSLASTSVITIRDGADGATVQVNAATSREGIYNSVTVVVERVDNTAPIRVTVRDQGPGSPTAWGGLFGKQNLVVKNQTPLTVSDAQILALRILRQSLALQRSWTIRLPHMPLLDPGDIFTLWYRDEVTAQVVESIQYSGAGTELTTITSRELTMADTALFA